MATKKTKTGCAPPSVGRAPEHARRLRQSVQEIAGVRIAEERVCAGHDSPWDFFSTMFLERPSLALLLGPRAGGKSFLSALETHLRSRWWPGHGTRVLGGSRAQSAQQFRALCELVARGPERELVAKLRKDGALYANGSEVEILSASSTSVRGPHVASLRLDEVDEIDPECREAAMGMCMNRGGLSASVLMTSTWHRVGGPMAELMGRAQGGAFPFYRYCAFEILERCPTERSGAQLENCPACPLMEWCHEDRDVHPLGLPKAKRSNGHYGIDALVQKVRGTSRRTFESDYLCRGPRAEGLWFGGYDDARGRTDRAEYDASLPVHLAVDPGVFTGAVFFQVAKTMGPDGPDEEIRVFADYLTENVPAEQNARALVEVARERCRGRLDAIWLDPSGGSRTSIGPTVVGEYARGGLKDVRPWPRATVHDGLLLVESFAQPADGRPRLLLHPRCVALGRAIVGYRRARRGGQWQDYPEDPQHPHEDLMDALRGGLKAVFPEGRRTSTPMPRVSARKVF